MLERNFQTAFGKWIRESWNGGSAAFELKVTATDSFSFSKIRPHQIYGLLAATKKLHYKLPDDTRGFKPFDMFLLQNAGAFLVIRFRSGIVMVTIEKIMDEMKNKKSITFIKASEIGQSLNFS